MLNITKPHIVSENPREGIRWSWWWWAYKTTPKL